MIAKTLTSGTSRIRKFALLGLILAEPAWTISLKGGAHDEIALTKDVENPSFTFMNDTPQPICDLLLSTNDSDGIDPDFEGDVVVRKPPGVTNLMWNEDPTPGNGVEDIKTFTNDPTKCVGVGDDFSVDLEFDGVSDDDILIVTPTNIGMAQIQEENKCNISNAVFEFFNGYEGLTGSLSGTCVASNLFPVSVSRVMITSNTSGVLVIDVSSSLPFSFDPIAGVLEFSPPIPPGGTFDYTIFIDGLAPFVHGDPDPFTKVEAKYDSFVFADGFESGNISEWSTTVPAL